MFGHRDDGLGGSHDSRPAGRLPENGQPNEDQDHAQDLALPDVKKDSRFGAGQGKSQPTEPEQDGPEAKGRPRPAQPGSGRGQEPENSEAEEYLVGRVGVDVEVELLSQGVGRAGEYGPRPVPYSQL